MGPPSQRSARSQGMLGPIVSRLGPEVQDISGAEGATWPSAVCTTSRPRASIADCLAPDSCRPSGRSTRTCRPSVEQASDVRLCSPLRGSPPRPCQSREQAVELAQHAASEHRPVGCRRPCQERATSRSAPAARPASSETLSPIPITAAGSPAGRLDPLDQQARELAIVDHDVVRPLERRRDVRRRAVPPPRPPARPAAGSRATARRPRPSGSHEHRHREPGPRRAPSRSRSQPPTSRASGARRSARRRRRPRSRPASRDRRWSRPTLARPRRSDQIDPARPRAPARAPRRAAEGGRGRRTSRP